MQWAGKKKTAAPQSKEKRRSPENGQKKTIT
jgi:hypothetical protein